MRLIVKNWKDMQHYKDRSPAWIKLQKSLIDDFDFQTLPVESRALAPMLWLIASESGDGSIDATYRSLSFRLRQSETEIEKAISHLIENGFLCIETDIEDECQFFEKFEKTLPLIPTKKTLGNEEKSSLEKQFKLLFSRKEKQRSMYLLHIKDSKGLGYIGFGIAENIKTRITTHKKNLAKGGFSIRNVAYWTHSDGNTAAASELVLKKCRNANDRFVNVDGFITESFPGDRDDWGQWREVVESLMC